MSADTNFTALRQHAVPLRTDDDLGAVLEHIADASLVLMGEASHGTGEFYQLRAALGKRLIRAPDRLLWPRSLQSAKIDARGAALLDHADPAAALRARERYSCIDHLAADPQRYGYATTFGLRQDCEDALVRQLNHLNAQTQQHLGSAVPDELFYAQQNARLAHNAERYYRAMFGSAMRAGISAIPTWPTRWRRRACI